MGKFIFQTPAVDLEKSISFFSKAGWQCIENDQKVLFGDGESVIWLNKANLSKSVNRLIKQ